MPNNCIVFVGGLAPAVTGGGQQNARPSRTSIQCSCALLFVKRLPREQTDAIYLHNVEATKITWLTQSTEEPGMWLAFEMNVGQCRSDGGGGVRDRQVKFAVVLREVALDVLETHVCKPCRRRVTKSLESEHLIGVSGAGNGSMENPAPRFHLTAGAAGERGPFFSWSNYRVFIARSAASRLS